MIRTTKRKVKYERIERLYCDVCAVEMEENGIVYTAIPVRYEYKCPKCGKLESFSAYYPSIETVYGEEEKYDE